MAAPPNYPLTIGRILELGWSLFRFAWRPMLGTAALILIPAYALMTVVAAAFSPAMNTWLAEVERSARAGLPPPATPSGFEVASIALLACGFLLLIASLATTGALVFVIDAVYRGERISARTAVGTALGRVVTLLGAQLLYVLTVILLVISGASFAAVLIAGGGLTTFLGLIVLVGTVAGVLFVAMRSALIAPAVIIDKLGAVESVGRSWRLTSGSGWRVFGYLILLALLGGLIGLIFGGLPSVLLGLSAVSSSGVAISTVIDALIAILASPLAPLVLTLLYFDLRWKQGEPVPLPGGGETPERSGSAPV